MKMLWAKSISHMWKIQTEYISEREREQGMVPFTSTPTPEKPTSNKPTDIYIATSCPGRHSKKSSIQHLIKETP